MHRDYDKQRAEVMVERFGRAFFIAGEVLRSLCEIEPAEAGNYSLRFETDPPQFVFSKSAEKLYYYNVPAVDFVDIMANGTLIADIESFAKELANKLRAGWETL